MAFFEWTESLSVGVKEFDLHHQKLIDVINKLFDAMSEGKGKTVIGEVLEELLKYADYHFGLEEKKMKEYDYLGYVGHHTEHQKFVEEITKFYREFQGGNMFLSVDTLNFLKQWLTKHILQTDMAYKSFFWSKGVK